MTTINVSSIIRGASNLNNAFAALSGKRADLIAETNLLLVSTIVHVHEHGDVTVLNAWASAFPASSTGNRQVMAFIRKFAPAKWVKADGAFKFDKGSRIASEENPNAFIESELGQLLLSSSYHTFEKEKNAAPEKTFDASLMTWNAVAALEKNLEKNGVSLDSVAMGHLAALKAAIKEQAVNATLATQEKAARLKALQKFAA